MIPVIPESDRYTTAANCQLPTASANDFTPANMNDLLVIFLLLLLGWFWLDSLRAREIAVGICQAACVQRDLQFLDQAVALRRLGLAWRAEGVRLRRVYRFDFSEEGTGRRSGYLVLRGLHLEELSFGLPDQVADA